MTDGHRGLQTLARFRSDRITGLSFHGSHHRHVKNGFLGEKKKPNVIRAPKWYQSYLAYELNGRDKKGFFLFLEFFGFYPVA